MDEDVPPKNSDPERASGARGWTSLAWRLAFGVVLVLVGGGLAYAFRDRLNLVSLAGHEQALRDLFRTQPAVTLAAAFAIYVLVTGLSLPGASPLSVLYGWLFGFWPALVLVSFASTGGATIAFLLSRYLFGRAIQARYGERLANFNAAIDREGAYYLFTLRLIPQVPFFVINVVMGLTKLPTRTFWWVSQLGMLPGTVVFVLAGATVPSLKQIAERGLSSILDWKLIGSLVLLGIVPLAVKKLLDLWRGNFSPNKNPEKT